MNKLELLLPGNSYGELVTDVSAPDAESILNPASLAAFDEDAVRTSPKNKNFPDGSAAIEPAAEDANGEPVTAVSAPVDEFIVKAETSLDTELATYKKPAAFGEGVGVTGCIADSSLPPPPHALKTQHAADIQYFLYITFLPPCLRVNSAAGRASEQNKCPSTMGQ